jgi:spore coat protein H
MNGFAVFYAVNQALGNWDTYGGFAHNFYLYGDPARAGQLRFIAWDFDLAFDGTGPTDLTLQSYDGSWPLIQALARDPVYAVRFHEQLRATYDAEFVDGALAARVDALVARVADAIDREDAVHEGVRAGFDDGVAALREHIDGQAFAIDDHLRATGF